MKPTPMNFAGIVDDNTGHVNPHPPASAGQITRVDSRILADLIELSANGDVAPGRLRLAGIPALPLLLDERRRRESARQEAA
jgi:hypothetical protein